MIAGTATAAVFGIVSGPRMRTSAVPPLGTDVVKRNVQWRTSESSLVHSEVTGADDWTSKGPVQLFGIHRRRISKSPSSTFNWQRYSDRHAPLSRTSVVSV